MIDTVSLPRGVIMTSFTAPPTTSLSISTSSLTNSGLLFQVPNNNNGNNPQTIVSFGGCPNCFVIDNELIYRCDECVRREELQREEQESVSRGSDPLSSPQDLPSSSSYQHVQIKTERISDDEQSPIQYNPEEQDDEEEHQESFHPSKRPRRSTANYLNAETTIINNNNNNTNTTNFFNTNPIRIKQETTLPSSFVFPTHRRSNVSLSYIHNTPSFEEQFQQTVSFAKERGWYQMVDFLISSLHKTISTNTNTQSHSVNNANNLLQVPNAVVGTMTSCPSSPSLPLVAPNSPLYLPSSSPNSVFPHFVAPPPSELLPGYYIYNKSIDSDTEQKEKVWIQIELPRDQVVDREGRFQTVSMGMEMGPLPHDPNSFVELDSIHLQGTEGTLITETLTKCVYVFDKLRIPNRALISEVLNTEYQGLRAGRFVFKVGDRVLPNRSARFVIKAPSGNRIRSVNSKAKKSKKTSNQNTNNNNSNNNSTLSTAPSTRRGSNRNNNYNYQSEEYDSDFNL
eukprot:TRINITY_DN40_c0_g3_i2.p1 TRINITY_DN40_c0_g3~~TRINITY_DN40_c0_g3_i2.p1  ORF type:complete len:511 (+),score=154.80 TRINITY_DN40_c0_g3_i2:356-1888(+)